MKTNRFKWNRLPGVEGPEASRPLRSTDAATTLAEARFRASLRDVGDLLVLLIIDAALLHWPAAHLAFLDRSATTRAAFVVNVLVAITIVLRRAIPRWRARRIAATWSPSERRRFMGSV